MQSLNDMVTAGKVLYLGASDTPAWIVSKANQYARDHGLRQFSVYQGNCRFPNLEYIHTFIFQILFLVSLFILLLILICL
jgi:aryl-alcohol dehydrogenase-like predicted oxidoreductase